MKPIARNIREMGKERGQRLATGLALPKLGKLMSFYDYTLPCILIESVDDKQEVFMHLSHKLHMWNSCHLEPEPEEIYQNDFSWKAFNDGLEEGFKQAFQQKIR